MREKKKKKKEFQLAKKWLSIALPNFARFYAALYKNSFFIYMSTGSAEL